MLADFAQGTCLSGRKDVVALRENERILEGKKSENRRQTLRNLKGSEVGYAESREKEGEWPLLEEGKARRVEGTI